MIIPRTEYTTKISSYLGAPIIKVISGIRRSGKSTILRLLIDELLSKGVENERILLIDMESLQFEHIRTYRELYDHARAAFKEGGLNYLFIDEIQEIIEWERAAASILSDGIADVIVTGSNANLLDSDLAARLTGRYVEIPVYPLRFREFIDFRQMDRSKESIREAWGEYLQYGGFPGIHGLPLEPRITYSYLNAIYNTVVLKDVINRHEIREPAQLDNIIRFLFDNCGNITTSKRITDYLKNKKLSVSADRIQNYLSYLEQAFLVYRCRRYDLQGKRHLELFDKFYMADIGIRHGLIGYRDRDISGLLENIVFLELRARGYRVSVGKYKDLEIDFVAEGQEGRIYLQICYLLASEETVEREFGALEKIDDNYPKYVLSMDQTRPAERGGIIWRNIVDFLLATDEAAFPAG